MSAARPNLKTDDAKPAKKAQPDPILDKSRDFGTSFPSKKRIAYEQGGRFFDVNGKLLRTDFDTYQMEHHKSAKNGAVKGRRRRVVERADQVEAEYDNVMPEDPADEDVTEGEVNLTAWATKQAVYRFSQVRDAIEIRYHRVVNDEFDALETLEAGGAVTSRQIKAAGWFKQ